MTTTAFKGSLSQFKIGDGASPEVFSTVYEVVSFGELGQDNDLIEATHLQSTAKEYIGGLPDGIEVPVVVNYKPTDTTHAALIAATVAGTAKNFKLTLPSGGGSLTFSFSGIVKGWRAGPIAPNEVVHASFTLKLTGAITGPV